MPSRIQPAEPSLLPAFGRDHRRLAFSAAALFVLALLLRLNGWSLPIWHSIIDGSSPTEILAGHAEEIRSDDFLLDLTMTLAQSKHRPAFPIINRNIGSGQFMPAPINVPAGAFITLFRPFTWGFLIGPDVGLAWKWWGLTLGLFYSLFLVFMLVSGNRFGLSAWASFGIVVSPYFQFWSLHKAEIAIHWAIAFVAAACLLAGRRRRVIWAAGALLGWSVAAMALDHIYPPIAVSLGWLLPFALAAWYWQRRKLLDIGSQGRHRLGASVVALAIAGGALAVFLAQSGDYIRLIRETIYPGTRFSTGGGIPLWPLFSHDFFAQVWDQGHPWQGNLCEDASFIFLFPLFWFLLIALAAGRRKVLEPWNALLAIYAVGLIVYACLGIPAWLAHATLMGMSTGNRVQLGLGLANQLMLVAACSNRDLRAAATPAMRWTAAIAWLGLLTAWGYWFRSHWPDLGMTGLWTALGFQAVLAFVFLIWDRPTLGAAFLALASCAYTMGFNPWVRGGTDFIFHNPLSAEIRRIGRADPDARWVVYGDLRLSNLPRMLGVKSIGGYNGYPDFETWALFDPDGEYRPVFNQSAYVAFLNGGTDPSFISPSPGYFIVEANPLAPAFERAGVRYFLVADPAETEFFRRLGGLRELFTYGGKTVFERK